MPYNMQAPRRTPSARVGSLIVGLGAKEIKWKCQRRGCSTLISRDEFACGAHLALLSEHQRAAIAVVLRSYPIGHRMVTFAARALDHTWEERRRG